MIKVISFKSLVTSFSDIFLFLPDLNLTGLLVGNREMDRYSNPCRSPNDVVVEFKLESPKPINPKP